MGCEAQVATHGYIIRWMDGICSRHPNIIVHITATSGTPRANNYPTLFNSNTSASRRHRVQLVRRVAQEPLVRGSKPLRC
jgi:hypothetical protein